MTKDDGARKSKPLRLLVAVGVLGLAGLFYLFCGVYSIQPIGAVPEGSTLVIWRGDGEPFFNSPDAMCLDRVGSVSLLCRGMAMANGPRDRIVLRLPYQRWAYRLSTGGLEFDR